MWFCGGSRAQDSGFRKAWNASGKTISNMREKDPRHGEPAETLAPFFILTASAKRRLFAAKPGMSRFDSEWIENPEFVGRMSSALTATRKGGGCFFSVAGCGMNATRKALGTVVMQRSAQSFSWRGGSTKEEKDGGTTCRIHNIPLAGRKHRRAQIWTRCPKCFPLSARRA